MKQITLTRARVVAGQHYDRGDYCECSDKDARYLINSGHAVEIVACPPKPKSKKPTPPPKNAA